MLNPYAASLLLAGLVWLGQAVDSNSAEVPNVAQRRTPTGDQSFDLQGFIDKEIKRGTTRVVVPPGRYRVTPQDRQHLLLRGLKDIQIIADGVEMICTETTRDHHYPLHQRHAVVVLLLLDKRT